MNGSTENEFPFSITSKEWDRLEVYLRGMGMQDSLEIHSLLSAVFEKAKLSSEPAFEIFLSEVGEKMAKDREGGLPPLEPGSMVPRPIDFGPLADLATSSSSEDPEPVALVLTVVFWLSVYISLAIWYFS
ncbi:hypothetical protein CH373_14615 [Leptospira perolatii]|uniref:Uncharacterized protein n=1 Tax=Leptospira perolatii TaxID=2023191 RepID=A0A2M9ZK51_9LEPT|nr:hypothetical protein [Leptospira perolatii]PJZ69237.1 hypothetical protein CH360_12005 [Leptospira perolatii]PJZ72381.1 hypothetical protein CH373_14615 [Leptospira perolatii]